MPTIPECVEVTTGQFPVASVVWLHGLGADGHDFEPIVPAFDRPGVPLRFVFPHAPIRPVTINMGMRMRAWYDIRALDRTTPPDEAGIAEADRAIHAIIEREGRRGVPPERIVLAGFSQGGAMALYSGLRYPSRLAGIVGLSTYLVLGSRLETEASSANAGVPMFLAHGTQDPLVLPHLGEETRAELEALGYPVTWRTYPIAHAVSPEEIADVCNFVWERLGGAL